MWPNPQFHADLVTFTKEILNGKLHFMCSMRTAAFDNNGPLNVENFTRSVFFSAASRNLTFSFMFFGFFMAFKSSTKVNFEIFGCLLF